MMKIPGVIVLYNPDIIDVISNVKSYIEQLDVLYVFDNSEDGIQNKVELEKTFFAKIKYYSYNENRGIAFALNFILEIVSHSEYDWILTMDQDSSFLLPDGFDSYFKKVKKEIDNRIALFCPLYPGETTIIPQFYTSGSIMNLGAWLNVGKFDEKLFIDEVDGDYTFRLSEAKYQLKKINNSYISHKLGDKCYRRIFNKTLCSDNHSALRKYYIARNRVYLMKIRPRMRLIYLSDSLIKFVLFILIEKDKKNKIIMIFKGIFDGLTNKMGKYTNSKLRFIV